METPKAGDRKHSNYFEGTIELVTYFSDDHFYFRCLSDCRRGIKGVHKNGARWSHLEPVRET